MSINSNISSLIKYITSIHRQPTNWVPNTVDHKYFMSKTFTHDLSYNIVNNDYYESFINHMIANKNNKIIEIKIDPSSQMKWVDPNMKFVNSVELPPPYTYEFTNYPVVGTRQSFIDLFEVYFMDWLRDLPFSEYNTTNYLTQIEEKAINYLNQLLNNNSQFSPLLPATKLNLFRGKTKGDLQGFYVSQFLLYKPKQNYCTAFSNIIPQYKANIPEDELQHEFVLYNTPLITSDEYDTLESIGREDYGLKENEFIGIQNGKIKNNITIPGNYKPFITGKRCILTGRDLASVVHADYPSELLTRACEILLTYGAPLSKNNPYVEKILGKGYGPFVNFSGAEVHNLMAEISREALKLVWYFKYHNMRMRPEEYAGKLHFQKKYNQENIPNVDTLINQILEDHKNINKKQTIDDTYLLSTVYPEGCPIHPAYPAGHAIIAAACVALMKCFFDEDYLFKNLNGGTMQILETYSTDYVINGAKTRINLNNNTTLLRPVDISIWNSITIGNELDKLASNIAFGRNFAGIHYRSDAEESFILGEKLAANFIRTRLREYGDKAIEYSFTNREGNKIYITKDSIRTE